jgi:hypothetical protein
MKIRQSFARWITSWLEMIDGLIGVLSFGFIQVSLCWKFMVFEANRKKGVENEKYFFIKYSFFY